MSELLVKVKSLLNRKSLSLLSIQNNLSKKNANKNFLLNRLKYTEKENNEVT
jgi:hypothetical protein